MPNPLPALVLLLVLHGSRDDLRKLTRDDIQRDVVHAVSQASPVGFGKVEVTIDLRPGSATRLEITQLPGEVNARLAPSTPPGKVVALAIRQALKPTRLRFRDEAFQIKVAAPTDTVTSIIGGSALNMAAIADNQARGGKNIPRGRNRYPSASRPAQEARAT